jgi:hypothetical protein
MMSILPLCLFASIALQDPAPAPPKPAEQGNAAKRDDAKPGSAPQSPSSARNAEESRLEGLLAEGWDVFDQVGVIVNNEIITLRQVRIEMKRRMDLRPVRKEDVPILQQQVIFEAANRLLAAQAGQDLGADEKLVDLQVKAWFDNWIESKGGVVAATKLLQADNRTTQDFRRELRQALYARNWRRWKTGEGTGVGTRPYQDRFVRPGLLQFRFENEIQDPARYGDLGGKPETYILQRILLDPDDHGGPDKALELASDLRRRILEGDDMTELVQTFGSKQEANKDGMFRDLNAARLKKNFPDIAAFTDKAQPGDVSTPIALKGADGKTMLQIVRVIEKSPAVKPEFGSQDVQVAMTKAVQNALDDYRLQRAFEELYRAAYIWPETAREERKP